MGDVDNLHLYYFLKRHAVSYSLPSPYREPSADKNCPKAASAFTRAANCHDVCDGLARNVGNLAWISVFILNSLLWELQKTREPIACIG